jgi:aryl-alcohol dehydrogenase-like predicted oxidoreductase
MIRGHATPEMTHAGLDRNRRVAAAELGRTGLHVSQAGFGGYRISAGVAEHAAALQRALVSGIALIDTSANYTDGGSEDLVGQVIAHMVDSGELRRDAVVVVSKAGYLQGKNYALSQERKRLGRPFPELVPYADGLEHCIHSEFLEDQLTRALERLRLEAIDVYLLHNPEYYLGWAAHNGMDPSAARTEYDRRIANAFRHLETEVARGRIRWYGISSNTFPAPASDPQFTCLERVWEMAESIGPEHHFGVVQLPMNLYEDGAVLLANQPCGMTALEFARQKNLGVLINRPLNAFTENRLLRLATAEPAEIFPAEEIEKRIETFEGAEQAFGRDILPEMELDTGLVTRLKAQFLSADAIRRAWGSLAGHEHWRQVREEYLLPRIRGVLEFLETRLPGTEAAAAWKDAYLAALDSVLHAVNGFYAESAAAKTKTITAALAAADPDWGGNASLSQLAVRALRSTAEISCVLVGMRRTAYVDDILTELATPVARKDRKASWQKLHQLL